ncbi:MAG: outer membrane beta-barrel protein [Chitinophagaceae bacterium]|nr:outer membrane beta-barrel protein [Chitinophagaceae bacterium]
MSDHDFEKQVQHKMEQLRLRPSDAVWTKVDKRIRQERRRRRVVLWLPLFLLCVVAGGYFIFENQSHNKFTASELNSTHNDNTGSQTNNPEKRENGKGVSQNVPVTGATTPASNKEQSDNNAQPGAGQSIPPAAPVADPGNGSLPNSVAAPKAPVFHRDAQPKDHAGIVSSTHIKRTNNKKKDNRPLITVATDRTKEQPDASIATGNDKDQDLAQNTTEPGVIVKPFKAETDEVDSSAMTQARSSIPVTADSLEHMLAQTKNSTKKKPEAPKQPVGKHSKWSFGIVAEGGASHISKGSPFELLSKENNEPEDLAYASPTVPNQSIVGGPAGFTQIPENKPAGLKSGVAWSAGGFVQRELNKRFSISIGAQYSYFSMKTQVGQFMKSSISVSNSNYDQVVSAYYQGRSAYMIGGPLFTSSYPRPPLYQDYTNKYHFLEIPVKIHWRMTREEQLPIILDGGLSVSRLIATNALHYDGSNDVYYKDYDYFNKIQAGISAGVNVALFNKSQHPVWIGPSIKYQLSNLITSDLSSGQHLWSFGLGAKFFLKRN